MIDDDEPQLLKDIRRMHKELRMLQHIVNGLIMGSDAELFKICAEDAADNSSYRNQDGK